MANSQNIVAVLDLQVPDESPKVDNHATTQSDKERRLPEDYNIEVETNESSSEPQWKAKKQELVILATMAILNVILALDATVLVPALPVSIFLFLYLLPLR